MTYEGCLLTVNFVLESGGFDYFLLLKLKEL
jgi:hypothetical protein